MTCQGRALHHAFLIRRRSFAVFFHAEALHEEPEAFLLIELIKTAT